MSRNAVSSLSTRGHTTPSTVIAGWSASVRENARRTVRTLRVSRRGSARTARRISVTTVRDNPPSGEVERAREEPRPPHGVEDAERDLCLPVERHDDVPRDGRDLVNPVRRVRYGQRDPPRQRP